MKKRQPIFIIFNFLVIAFLCGCAQKKLYKETQVMMGTFVQVISPEEPAAAIAFKEIRRIDRLLSKYDPDSEISRLNRDGSIKASPETFFVVKKAKEFFQDSAGAFDVTVAPLVELWGFKDMDFRVPGPADIRKAMKLVGSDKIILQEADSVIKFKTSGMSIDLGGIAKGYAIDRAVVELKKSGIKSCLINAGGQVYCLGDKFGKPWNIALQDPRKDNFVDYLRLTDSSVATSGDYQRYFIKDNVRYSHIIDPKTGSPATSGLSSVTVIGPDGLVADALSTAIFVLGQERSAALINKFPEYKIKMIKG